MTTFLCTICVIEMAILILLLKSNKLKKTNLIKLRTKLSSLTEDFNYKKDFEYLDTLIEEKCSYAYLLELKQKIFSKTNTSNMINDDYFTLVVTKTAMSVEESLSEEYLNKLKCYNSEIKDYILEKVFVTLLMLSLNVNKEIVGSIIK